MWGLQAIAQSRLVRRVLSLKHAVGRLVFLIFRQVNARRHRPQSSEPGIFHLRTVVVPSGETRTSYHHSG
jgi:hypothetical protein